MARTGEYLMAEGVGFEPTVPENRNNGFQDRRIQPLCHPSVYSILLPAGLWLALPMLTGVRLSPGADPVQHRASQKAAEWANQ